jgi:hypothetical protein
MAIETLAITNRLEPGSLHEKSDAYADNASRPANPVIKSAEFALLVSADLHFLDHNMFISVKENQYYPNK